MKLQPILLVVSIMIANDENTLGVPVSNNPDKEYLVKRVVLKGGDVETVSRHGWATNHRNESRKVWNPFDTKTKLACLDGVRATAFAFGDRQDTAYAGDIYGNVYEWNLSSTKRQILFTRDGEQGSNVIRVRASSASGLLVAGCYNGRVHCFWDLEAKKEVFRVEKWISALSFSPNGKLVFLRSEGGLESLDTKTFTEIWSNPLKGSAPGIGAIEMSSDGHYLIVCGMARSSPDAEVQLLNPANGKAVREPIIYKYTPPPFRTENIPPTFPAAQISPGGLFLASSFNSPTVDLWEMATMRKAFCVAGDRNCTNIVFCSSTRLITVGDRVELCLWDLAKTEAFKRFREQAALRKELVWAALKSLDPLYGVAATEYFCTSPKEFLAIVREKGLISSPPPKEKIDRLIKNLGHSVFATRESAQRDLMAFGELAESALREARKQESSTEARKRIDAILSAVPKADGLGEYDHRQLRAVMILEKTATDECVALLKDLERRASNPIVVERTREALQRLKRQ